MSVRRLAAARIFVLPDGQPLERVFALDRRYAAVVYRHEGAWHLLARPEVEKLRGQWRRSGRSAVEILGARGKVGTVTLGTKPRRAALVVDASGKVSAAWLPEEAGGGSRAPTRRALRRRPRRRTPRSTGGSAGGSEMFRMSTSYDLDLSAGAGDAAESEAPPAAAADEPPGDGPPSVETIRRTPHLDAPEEIAKAPGTEFVVSVYVDSEELRAGESGEGIELELPAGVEKIDVGVLLLLSKHFELVEGSEFRELTILRDEDKPAERLEFKVRVLPGPPEEEATISALFTLRGRSCGHVARAWDWSTEAEAAPCLATEAEAPVSMPLHIGGEQASLSIFITAAVKGGRRYHCAVQAPALEGYEEPTEVEEFEIPAEGYAFMKTLLNALIDENRSPAVRFRALKGVGQEAWEAVPDNVQKVLWLMIDTGVPPRTINVASVEPLLPWELMIPQRRDGKEPKEIGPLGVEFAVGRWTRVDGQAPSPRLAVDRSFVVAPDYKAGAKLAFAAELELIETRLCGSRVVPATVNGLDDRFAADRATLLHFVCHGDAGVEDDDAIELEGEKEVLRAHEVRNVGGFKRLCEEAHPLVFLNSCSTAQMVPSLAGGSGFPRSFGDIGANAIIAPLWPVDDELASKVAVELYEKALAPGADPIAEILRDIRARGYEEEDADTFAAYCFFGDPQARLELLDCAG